MADEQDEVVGTDTDTDDDTGLDAPLMPDETGDNVDPSGSPDGEDPDGAGI
jgi:hypothetical protein